MLEGLAAWVLNTYVGGYVENLNTHQLSIGLLRGQVELENLPLKKDAFRHLLLPLEIKAGFIGKLSLKIPVTRLRSEPWLITIEQLYIVIGPVSLDDYDEAREEQVLQNVKISKLDAMEAKWKASYESKQEPSYYAYSYAAWLTCGTSVMTNIIKNLQFKIKDIHIRYEDGCTDSRNPFACGITIQTLSSQAAATAASASATNDTASQTSGSEPADDVANQSVQLSGVAVYWDSDVALLGGLDIFAMAEAMKKQQTHVLSSARSVKPHAYLLATTSFQTQISRNCSPQPLRVRSKPRFTCNLQLDKFSVTLNEEQYRQMVFCLKELERIDVSWKYRRWRPSVPVSGNAILWWQFASQAHIHHLTKKRSQASWEFAHQRARQVRRYVDIYYCHLTKPECLTTELQKEKNTLEQQLEFDTLLSLRELVIQKVRREQSSWSADSRGQGLLQYWFPGWTGWYTKQEEAPQPPLAEDEASDDDASSISTTLTTQIEEEILDALDSVDRDTFLMRDAVLARVCFSLSQCGLTLVGRHQGAPIQGAGDEVMQPLVELRFADVTVDVESRPRLGSFLFAARLGSLHLQDRTAPNSAYPYVLSPHTVEALDEKCSRQSRVEKLHKPHLHFLPLLPRAFVQHIATNEQLHVFPKGLPLDGTKAQASIFKFLPFSSPSAAPFGIPLITQKVEYPNVPLFELTYEKKPLGSNADHRLVVNTQSLDVVYNPSTIRTVKQFFTLFNYEGNCSPSSGGQLNLSAAARSRYEMFKKHTKEELRHHWDLMLEGEESTLQIAKWDIHMDISAPQIIVPESFTDHNSTTVLIDLGRVQFSNSSAPPEASHANVDDISDDEAEFKTPCSSPPELEQLVNETVVQSPVKETPLSNVNIYDHMYKKYTLNLQDMQVLIGTSKDSWKFAQSKGTSRMHVLDRFSISIQVERRLLATDDPHWPSIILNMKLPKLTAHVNEQKVHAMHMCLSRLKESTSTRPAGWSPQGPPSPFPSSEDLGKAFEQEGISGSALEKRARESHETSLLLLAQCSIEQMCLEVQSRGRCIAELQVTGVQATFSKTPQDSSVTMSVHGLLLVDALQTYGPDFELLVASHRHVSMDSRSGSIRDSDPNSPTSPATPPLLAMQPAAPMQTIAVPKILSAILSTLQSASPKVLLDRHRASPIGMLDAHETDALITVEISIVNVPSSTPNGAAEQVFIAAVQFNNLDVIANQETIVELVNFARCLKPPDALKVPPKRASAMARMSMSSQFDLSPSSVQATPNQVNSMQLTFDFHRFNVLLLRAVSKKGSVSGQKVATATISGARIQTSIGSTLEIQGTLGGLQVCDLISEKTLYRRIVSMGSDPHLMQDLHDPLGKRHHAAGLYRSLPLADPASSEKAFEFTVKRYAAQSSDKQAESECLEVVVRMASVCYTHSPMLLHELASCAAEFKHCVSMLAQSIKNAATEVALGIVNLPAQTMALSFHVCPPSESVTLSAVQREVSVHEASDVQAALPLDVKLDILLQTPVIVLPASPSSHDVLVAHLGRISVQNTNSSVLQSAQFAFNSCDPHKAGLFFVQFRDVNLYSLNINENIAAAAAGKRAPFLDLPSADSLPVVDLYSCRAHGRPILHDTVIEFTVQYKQPQDELDVGWFSDGTGWLGDHGDQRSTSVQPKGQPILEVSGTVINVLKFAVTKYQYELLLKSAKNITYYRETGAEEDVAESLHLSSSWEELISMDAPFEHDRPDYSLGSVTEDGSKHMAISYRINFVLPELIMNICSDLCNDKQDLVALSFQEFVVNYERDNPYETSIQLALKGIVMEDLVEHPESSHRYLIRSSNPDSQQAGDSKDVRPPKSDFISFSCPDMKYHIPTMAAHPSLPDRLCTQNAFQAHLKKSRATEHAKKRGHCSSTCASPSTPPPSPSGSMTPVALVAPEDSLMHINMRLIDRHCPDFASKHNSVSRTVTVDLNSLETMINSQTWVMVLDFLGLAADLPEDPRPASRQDSQHREDSEIDQEIPAEVDNTELEVNIHNFVVTLNKPSYELARATISGFSSHLSLRDSNITLRASLGKICVLDLTGHGQLYRERFITAGPEALHFSVFKYGAPDPNLQRDCDVKVKCEMSSVQVVHTQRFLTEVIDFFADFSELQMLLRAATAGNKMNLEACRAPRVQLEVTAASPVIVVPQSYRSFDVLVANLGNLNITTTFRFTGEDKSASSSRRSSVDISQQQPAREGCIVISAEGVMRALDDLKGDKCLLQAMDVELVDMDVYSGVCVPACQAMPLNHPAGTYTVQFPSIFIKKNGGPLLKQTLMLHLLVEKNLDSAFNHLVPDWTVEGSFSSVHVTLDRSQYALVHGILSRNLAEKVERSSASNLTLVELFPEQGNQSENSWTFLAIRMTLVNVTLELVHAHARPQCANAESTLAKVELIRSKLTLEWFSDQSNDFDLVSNEIRILDTRFKDAPVNNRPNVFTNILSPTKNASKEKVLQAEIHYRVTHNTARFTVLLNNMRVMAIFSWISELAEFLSLGAESHVSTTVKQVASTDPHPVQQHSTVRRMTKQWQQQPVPEVPLELKLNMTDTEIVVVEDSAAWDTNTVILKSTAVLSYHKALTEKPLSCNLQNLEVFSCILGLEDDTALSIIDPISVYIDLVEREPTSPGAKPGHVLQVGTLTLNLRLSYNDVKMFLRILDSIPKQLLLGGNKVDVNIDSLLEMGFSHEDCLRSLEACRGNLDDAAIWLTQNASACGPNWNTVPAVLPSAVVQQDVVMSAVELKVSSFCLCIIDDCMDADVPLLEIELKETYIFQELSKTFGGQSKFFFSIGYYNRALSGWEPIIEPWRCNCQWEAAFGKTGLTKFHFKINAEDVLKVNITTALLDLYQKVKTSWATDFYQLFSAEKCLEDKDAPLQGDTLIRRRSPFVPFAIKNDLGVAFRFTAFVAAAFGGSREEQSRSTSRFDWKDVEPGQVVPFTFQGRGKIRHQDSHELRMHRLVLKIAGYGQLEPVSVEKVGVYFKYAIPVDRQHRSSGMIRVVFSVTLDGNARKLITVQSALVIKNKVEVPVDVKLETAGVRPYQICLQPKCTTAVPLPYVFADMWVRPTISLIAYSSLEWQHVASKRQSAGYSITCCPIRNDAALFRFSVDVKRDNYPDKDSVPCTVPGHTVSLLPPIRIHNLLPCELGYVVNEGQCKGIISAQKDCALHEVNTEQYVIIGFSLENFRQCTSLVVPPGSSSFSTRLETHDTEGRLLLLHARVSVLRGRALRVYVSVPYWIINRSGLPLIFKQEGTNCESAGQFPEHEQARSMVPLLFSFADSEASMMCSMRVGMELHPRSFPQWCTCFSLEKGIKVRRLMVSPNDARPDWVYTIGVEIQQGRGKYACTNYIVLSPRFLIDNQSSCVVQIAQRFATKELHQHRHHISLAKPKSSLPFHWPRVDLDNLLCVRLVDAPGCLWSGGFKIDELNSFHVHMRDDLGRSYFLRVEVILKGAMFFIIFMDCAKIPPPLRIDNQSEVAVTFHQTSVSNELLRATVKAHTSVPYAWDEPTLPPHITVTAPGGMSETYDMTIFRPGKKLYYENFFYIAFSGTFLEPRAMVKVQPGSKDVKCQELVLDVPQGTRVVINKKELGKRSQLWRMTSTGMLQHEGSSTPRDPRPSAEPGRMLVLDIASLGPEPKKYTELMLRKPDGRRRLTQTWQFCSDGRLCCQLPGMFVQPRDGFHGLRRGNDVVLGPPQPVSFECMPNGVPLEQAVANQKMRGGSGVLSVQVIPKGPTIVLCISDFMQKQKISVSTPSPNVSMLAQKASSSEDPQAPQLDGRFGIDLELNLHLMGGVGVSVINHLSEELLYAVLQNIRVNFIQSPSSQILDASVENMQVDNQLHGAERPVALYVTPLHERDRQRHLPAIVITAERLPQKDTDVVIFQHFIMHVKNVTVALEELLMLKIVQFLHHQVDDLSDEIIMDNQLQRANAAASANARRFYFNTLKLRLDQVKLSVLTMSHRPPELDTIKKKVGWSLMRFEDVVVELDSFVKSHPFESLEFLVNNVVEHYKGEFQSHAAKILGAVDFLGDPVGLFNDVCTGWSEFIKDGNATSLVKGVTHGLSNSTAKMAGSLSESLTTVADPGRQLEQRSRSAAAPDSSERHLMTGLRRLGSGVVGGFTSIARHSYHGAVNEGVQGLLTGLGKGLIGTVAMPAAGILDLVTEAASYVRDTSKPPSHMHPRRFRAPRLCSGPGGLLPCYSTTQALGQQFLCNLADASSDLFVAMEQLESRPDGPRVLISTERAFIIKREAAHTETILHVVPYSTLSYCRWFPSNLGLQPQPPFYVEFLLRPENQRLPSSCDLRHGSLRIGCENEATARKVVQQINYARDTYEERKYTAHFSDSEEDKD